jgi:hypothetical protein
MSSNKPNLSKDGSFIDFKQSENVPTTAKKFRQSAEIQGFYSFVYDNGLQQEAFDILSTILLRRRAERTKAGPAASAANVVAAPAASTPKANAKAAKGAAKKGAAPKAAKAPAASKPAVKAAAKAAPKASGKAAAKKTAGKKTAKPAPKAKGKKAKK